MNNQIKQTWQQFIDELSNWKKTNTSPIFWIRDDDITEENENIFKLINLCISNDTPLYLAAIPKKIDRKLISKTINYSECYILQHGFSHQNHAPKKHKKSEFHSSRELNVMCSEIKKGYEILVGCCREKLLPVFVPPWNRMTDRLFPCLLKSGLQGYSSKNTSFKVPENLIVRDAHLDIADWKNNCKFIGETTSINMLINQLQLIRTTQNTACTPICVLTHHKVMDKESFSFLNKLIITSKEFGAIWGSPKKIFGGEFDLS